PRRQRPGHGSPSGVAGLRWSRSFFGPILRKPNSAARESVEIRAVCRGRTVMSEPVKPARRRLTWLAIGVAGVAVLAGVGLFARGGAPRTGAERGGARDPVIVSVETVAPRAVRRTVGVVGSLYGRDEITLTPKVEGPVVEICCDVGDAVKPGDLL